MQPVITAEELKLSAARGRVYGPLSFTVTDPLSVLCGPAGSGRTSLLLTLAGRMKPDSGSLEVLGLQLPRQARQAQRQTGIAGFRDIDELEPGVTAGAAVRERLAWLAPWWRFVPRVSDRQMARICGQVFGQLEVPPAGTVIWDLGEAEQFLLRISLAMLARPSVLFVDDIEQLQSSRARAVVEERLAALAAAGTAVVVGTASLPTQPWSGADVQPSAVLIAEEAH
ncbi:ATP-binding cassette domain-containing protein [Arthrobacter gandavensis]|uniref:ATP-binding cassette domain-containing protein n=1 Tax=Arthrobacter gandavensis TaxID=169960 RepID=UPI00188F26D2|nr:ATP-binding cassette domain-containing protein [Arthrobacter gandavensis]MBF4992896.1 ATP-binding cassette domain-containing protein [Arthrobacter gandavensis]